MDEDLRGLLTSGAPFAARVTPRASRPGVTADPGPPPLVHVRVSEPAESGRANAAVIRSLAAALAVPKSRVELIRGGTSRAKLFRVRAP